MKNTKQTSVTDMRVSLLKRFELEIKHCRSAYHAVAILLNMKLTQMAQQTQKVKSQIKQNLKKQYGIMLHKF